MGLPRSSSAPSGAAAAARDARTLCCSPALAHLRAGVAYLTWLLLPILLYFQPGCNVGTRGPYTVLPLLLPVSRTRRCGALCHRAAQAVAASVHSRHPIKPYFASAPALAYSTCLS